jgi:hypothetical protein
MRLATGLTFGVLAMLVMMFAGCGSAPPVACQQRQSFAGRGIVVIVTNSSQSPQSLWLESSGKRSTFALSAGGQHEFGFLQGHEFGVNSSFTIGGEGFATKSYQVKDLTVRE